MARMYKKLTIIGGEGGREWDDDVYEHVRKVYVGQDSSRISYVKFEYVKEDGEVVTREYGTIDQQPKVFELYPNEHIKAVEGSYKSVSLCGTEVITSLTFKTTNGRASPTFGANMFGLVSGTKFVLEEAQGKEIVGFHGRSGNALDAIGVYFALDSLATLTTSTTPVYKVEAQGGPEGRVWDDGCFDGVKTVRLGRDDSRVTYLECEYVKGEKLETRCHGKKGDTQIEFVLVPGEHIKSVEATYHKPNIFRSVVITSLKFETTEGRTSFFGYETGKKFVLKQKDRRLVGFHGREGDAIDALGAYFAPIPTHVLVTKLPSVGGNGGVAWDDGVHDDVKKIYVGQGNDGVSFVKFEYVKGENLVCGDDHGKKTLLGAEEFVLEDGEYLTALEGYYDKIFGVKEPVIISLKFKTNKRESSQFGMDSGEKFSLGEKGHKIVGFHGHASDVIHSVGVSLVPITTTK